MSMDHRHATFFDVWSWHRPDAHLARVLNASELRRGELGDEVEGTRGVRRQTARGIAIGNRCHPAVHVLLMHGW